MTGRFVMAFRRALTTLRRPEGHGRPEIEAALSNELARNEQVQKELLSYAIEQQKTGENSDGRDHS